MAKIVTQTMDANRNVTRSLEVDYDFGSTLAEAVAKFGERVVYEYWVDNATIALQAMIRNRLNKTGDKAQSDAAIRADVAKWVPKIREADPIKKVEAIKKGVASLSASERAALLAELQAGDAPKPAAPRKRTAA